jgi:hypothetical protein
MSRVASLAAVFTFVLAVSTAHAASVTVTPSKGARLVFTIDVAPERIQGGMLVGPGRDVRISRAKLRAAARRGRLTLRTRRRAGHRLRLDVTSPAVRRSAPGARQSVSCGWGTFGVGSWPGACWRPYSDDSFFNRPLPENPRLHPRSGAIVSKMFSAGKVPPLPLNPEEGGDWFHPLYFSKATDPEYTIKCIKYGGECEIAGERIRIPAAARPADGNDAHLTVIDQATGWEYDLWAVQSPVLPRNGGVLEIGYGGKTRIDGMGGGDEESASNANAAETGNAGGIIRLPELQAGRIDHALFMFAGCSNGRYVYPALGKGAPCDDVTDAPAIGQWLQLDMTAAEIEAQPVGDWLKTVMHALREYGGMIGDTGGNESIGFAIESPASYTSFGPNPWLEWAEQARKQPNSNIVKWEGRYELEPGKGVDWQRHLRVVDPCVIQRTC